MLAWINCGSMSEQNLGLQRIGPDCAGQKRPRMTMFVPGFFVLCPAVLTRGRDVDPEYPLQAGTLAAATQHAMTAGAKSLKKSLPLSRSWPAAVRLKPRPARNE